MSRNFNDDFASMWWMWPPSSVMAATQIVQSELSKLQNNRSYSEDEKLFVEEMKKSWLSDNDINKYLNYFNSEMTSFENNNSEATKEGLENKWFLEKTGDTLKSVWEFWDNTVWSFLSSAPRIVWNVSWFIPKALDYVIPDALTWWKLDEFWNYLISEWEKQSNDMKNMLWVQKWSVWEAVWDFAWDVITTVAWDKWLSKLWKVTNISEKLWKTWEVIKTVTNNKIINNKLTKWAVEWAKDMAIYDVVSKWEINKNDLAIWWAVWATIPIVGGMLNKARNIVWKALPEKMTLTWLVNPSDLKNLWERYAKLTWKDPDPSEIWAWILEKWIKWDKWQIREQIAKYVDDLKIASTDLLNTNKEIYTNEVVDSLKDAIAEKLPSYLKKVGDNYVPKAWSKDIVAEIQYLLNKEWLTAKEINDLRGILWKDIFNKTWDFTESVSLEWWKDIWKNASQFLDDTIPNFRKINKDIEIWNTLSNAILKKESNDLTKKMLSYVWIWATWWWVGSYSTWKSPMQILQDMIIWWTLWWAWWKFVNKFNSPEIQTRLAWLLRKLWPKEKNQIINFSQWKINNIHSDLVWKIEDIIRKEINNNFNIKIDKIKEWYKVTGDLSLWIPSEKLLSANIKDSEMFINSKTLQIKSNSKKHPFDLNDIKDFPDKINNPIWVFESHTVPWNKIILTDLKKDWKNFVWILRLMNNNEIEVQRIVSIYDRNFKQILESLKLWNAEYIDKEKMVKYFSDNIDFLL